MKPRSCRALFFELDDHVRVSIALPPDDLREALQRISRVIRERLAEDP
ncbi:MAG: hypothetical protein IIC02_00410 [Planctomycetes bacterium]|nr:hypothetical protein [Planctomycetota bacterium]